MDSVAQDGMYDVYVVDTTGAGVPVRVSPEYATAGVAPDEQFTR